jgi:hypothetical protein
VRQVYKPALELKVSGRTRAVLYRNLKCHTSRKKRKCVKPWRLLVVYNKVKKKIGLYVVGSYSSSDRMR